MTDRWLPFVACISHCHPGPRAGIQNREAVIVGLDPTIHYLKFVAPTNNQSRPPVSRSPVILGLHLGLFPGVLASGARETRQSISLIRLGGSCRQTMYFVSSITDTTRRCCFATIHTCHPGAIAGIQNRFGFFPLVIEKSEIRLGDAAISFLDSSPITGVSFPGVESRELRIK